MSDCAAVQLKNQASKVGAARPLFCRCKSVKCAFVLNGVAIAGERLFFVTCTTCIPTPARRRRCTRGRSRLAALLALHKPSHVIIALGANDALRGLPIAETELNLRKMIQMSKKSGAKVLLMGMQIPPNYGQNYTSKFKSLYPTLAKEESIQLLPFFLEGVATRTDLFQTDRIHPNVEAQNILFKNVWGAMAPYQSMLK